MHGDVDRPLGKLAAVGGTAGPHLQLDDLVAAGAVGGSGPAGVLSGGAGEGAVADAARGGDPRPTVGEGMALGIGGANGEVGAAGGGDGGGRGGGAGGEGDGMGGRRSAARSKSLQADIGVGVIR